MKGVMALGVFPALIGQVHACVQGGKRLFFPSARRLLRDGRS